MHIRTTQSTHRHAPGRSIRPQGTAHNSSLLWASAFNAHKPRVHFHAVPRPPCAATSKVARNTPAKQCAWRIAVGQATCWSIQYIREANRAKGPAPYRYAWRAQHVIRVRHCTQSEAQTPAAERGDDGWVSAASACAVAHELLCTHASRANGKLCHFLSRAVSCYLASRPAVAVSLDGGQGQPGCQPVSHSTVRRCTQPDSRRKGGRVKASVSATHKLRC